MLVGYTEDNVDENVLSIKNKFTDKLKNMNDLYSKIMSTLAEDKIKYNLYVVLVRVDRYNCIVTQNINYNI